MTDAKLAEIRARAEALRKQMDRVCQKYSRTPSIPASEFAPLVVMLTEAENDVPTLLSHLAAERERVAALTREKDERNKDLRAIAAILKPNYSNDLPLVDECIIAIQELQQTVGIKARQVAKSVKLIDYLWKRRDDLKELWFVADQTIGCQLCGWIDWEDETGEIPPHSDECHLGYLMNRHVPKFELDEARQELAASQSRAERAEGELAKMRECCAELTRNAKALQTCHWQTPLEESAVKRIVELAESLNK